MSGVASANQKQAVEFIMVRMNEYLEARFSHARRINPSIEQVWPDIAWQQTTNLRRTLAADKPFGPERVFVAELLLSDNRKRIADLFMQKSQNCLLGELVETKEGDGHRTHGAMEIHDMRTLFRGLDPKVESIVAVVQTFIWWDLEDGCDLARFDHGAMSIEELQSGGLSPEKIEYYKERTHSTKEPSVEDAILYECRQLAVSRDAFRARRGNEQAYQMVVAHEHSKKDNPDAIIEAMGSQLSLRDNLRKGAALPPALAEQLSRAIHCGAEEVTSEKALAFLENAIATNRKRLQNALLGGGGGTPYNFKLRQLTELEERFKQIVGDRQLGVVPADPPSSAG